MKTILSRFLGIAMLMLLLPAYPAMAQTFFAEIDCGDVWMAGDSVPYTVRLENQTLNNIALNISVLIRPPGFGVISLLQAPVTLGPNQDLFFDRILNLPQTAPSGSYTMVVVGRSDTETSFDTCSFNVTG